MGMPYALFKEYKDSLEELWHTYDIQKLPLAKEVQQRRLGRDQWRMQMCNCMQRSFSGHPSQSLPFVSDFSNIVPGADFFNHDELSPNCAWNWVTEGDDTWFEVKTISNITFKGELTVSYGEKTAEDTLLVHGFVSQKGGEKN